MYETIIKLYLSSHGEMQQQSKKKIISCKNITCVIKKTGLND